LPKDHNENVLKRKYLNPFSSSAIINFFLKNYLFEMPKFKEITKEGKYNKRSHYVGGLESFTAKVDF